MSLFHQLGIDGNILKNLNSMTPVGGLLAGRCANLNKLEMEFMFVLLQIIVTSQNIVLKPGVAVHSCDSNIQEIEPRR